MKNSTKTLLALLILNFGIFTILIAQNNCLDFDGTNEYVATTSTINLSGLGNDLTLEAWIYVESFQSASPYISSIIGMEDGLTGTALIRLGDAELANNKVQFVLSFDNGGTLVQFKLNGTTGLSINTWYHVAATFERTSLYMKIYINGVQEPNTIYGGYENDFTANDEFYIGAIFSPATRFLDGKIDEVRVWSTTRTQAEIRANMYKELAGTETGLVAYYKLNEATGTNANDSQTSSNYDGTLYNMEDADWLTSSAFAGPKNCLDFDGIDDYVDCGNDASLDITDAITICAWIIPGDGITNSQYHYQAIVEKDSYYNETYALLVKKNIYYIKFPLKLDGVEHIHAGYGPVEELWDGNFHHIAATYDKNGGNDNYLIYVDGVLRHSDTLTGSIGTKTNSLTVGGHSYDGNLFEGKIDEVQIWDVALTARQIRENMCKTLTGNESGLVAYYNFDNSSGITLQDFSGNENDGTLTNMEDADWIGSSAFNTWLNTSSTNWSTTTNWSRGSEPVSTDNVGLPNYTGGNNPVISSNTTVNNLVVENNVTLTINSSQTLTNNDNFFNYGTISGSGNITNNGYLELNGSVTCSNLTNNSGKTIQINAGKQMTVNGTLTNSAGTSGLVIKSDATGTGSLIHSTAGVNAKVEQYLTSERWHLVSPPISNATINVYFDIYLKEWNEPDSTWTYLVNPTTSPMNVTRGYAAWASDVYTGTTTVSYPGTLNTGDKSPAISYTTTATHAGKGWNLIGNPYPCALDWNINWSITDLSGWAVVYDNGTYRGWNPYLSGDNRKYNGKEDGIIPITQGFWIRALSISSDVTIPQSERVHNNQVFYKDDQENTYASIRLEADCNGYKDEAVVIFHPEGSAGFDGLYDLGQFANVSEAPRLYSITEEENFAVNIMPENYHEVVIPIGFKTGQPGIFIITATSVANFIEDINIYLEDINTGDFVKLYKNTQYEFGYNPEENDHRFNLHFTEINYGIEDNIQSVFNIYSCNDVVYIQNPENIRGDIYIYNLMGQEVANAPVNSALNKITLNKSGNYIVKVLSGKSVVTRKVFIK